MGEQRGVLLAMSLLVLLAGFALGLAFVGVIAGWAPAWHWVLDLLVSLALAVGAPYPSSRT